MVFKPAKTRGTHNKKTHPQPSPQAPQGRRRLPSHVGGWWRFRQRRGSAFWAVQNGPLKSQLRRSRHRSPILCWRFFSSCLPTKRELTHLHSPDRSCWGLFRQGGGFKFFSCFFVNKSRQWMTDLFKLFDSPHELGLCFNPHLALL